MVTLGVNWIFLDHSKVFVLSKLIDMYDLRCDHSACAEVFMYDELSKARVPLRCSVSIMLC